MKIFATITIMFLLNPFLQAQTSPGKSSEIFQCTPCGNDCDHQEYTEAGKCPQCKMPLVKKSTIMFKTISPADICAYLQQHPDVVLLDVRTKDEYERKSTPDYGVLKNAINIPIQELESQLPRISSLKNKEIIVYCSHSKRSSRASYMLTQNGFTNITNLSGGISTMSDASCKE
jgi:rhodanese-related sulfurtransferase